MCARFCENPKATLGQLWLGCALFFCVATTTKARVFYPNKYVRPHATFVGCDRIRFSLFAPLLLCACFFSALTFVFVLFLPVRSPVRFPRFTPCAPPAQGLYYIADLVEEHGQLAKRVLKWTLVGVICVHLLLFFFEEDVPSTQVLLGIAAHVVYFTLLPEFPYVKLASVRAIAACVMALVDHFAWFYHMMTDSYYSYSEICGIFVLCVWIAPLFFIVSLSTTEPLPYGASPDLLSARRKGTNRIAALFRFLRRKQDELLPRSVPKSL